MSVPLEHWVFSEECIINHNYLHNKALTEIPNKCEAKSKLLTISPASTSKGGSNRWGSGAKEAPCVNWKKKNQGKSHRSDFYQ